MRNIHIEVLIDSTGPAQVTADETVRPTWTTVRRPARTPV